MIEEAEARTTREHKLFWWKEALIIAIFYVIYSAVRNRFGSTLVDEGQEPVAAFNNAMRVIRVERAIGLYHEETVQDWFLPAPDGSFPAKWFIQFWNTYYGIAHFVVTIGAFIWMFRRGGHNFPRWRNALALTTALAIVGFSLFPLMPPRLLNDDGIYGGDRLAAEQGRGNFGYVDTLEEYGGPWSFDSGTMQRVSNQYAAMPSLHIGWSTWCALVMWQLTRKRWVRGLLILYPLATLFCIVVTANHYWIDGIGGLLALALGYWFGHEMHEWNNRRLTRRYGELPVAEPPIDSSHRGEGSASDEPPIGSGQSAAEASPDPSAEPVPIHQQSQSHRPPDSLMIRGARIDQ